MNINALFQKLVPTDLKFYPMFEELSDLIIQSSVAQLHIFEHDDPVKQKDLFRQIKEVENNADEVVRKIFDSLDKSFVPPFDREDIHLLTTSMDMVIDLTNEVAQRIRQYRPKEIPPDFKDFSKLISKGCEEINLAVH